MLFNKRLVLGNNPLTSVSTFLWNLDEVGNIWMRLFYESTFAGISASLRIFTMRTSDSSRLN